MQITVKLHASLRPYGKSDSKDGLFPLETSEKTTVREVIREMGIPPEKVRMILLNGRGADSESALSNGDRLALFPPEMAFNMYVAISFRRDLNHQEKSWVGGELVRVYVKLMGSLLPHGSPRQRELMEITVEAGATVREAIQVLGIPKERVKLIFVNHTGAFLDQSLREGDRVSLFPAEYPVFADWKRSIVGQGQSVEMVMEGKMKKWKCSICGYVYDPSKGDPDNGVKPGTAFEEIPEDWVCPVCGAGKDVFEAD